MIEANRRETANQLKKEGKTSPPATEPRKGGLGVFPSGTPSEANRRTQKDAYSQRRNKAKAEPDYEEIMDHLEEPDFDPEEL